MTATVVAVMLALFWLAPWQHPLRLPFTSPSSSGSSSDPTTPAPASTVAPGAQTSVGPLKTSPVASGAPAAEQAVASLAPQTAPAAANTALGSTSAPASTAPGSSGGTPSPSFDIVRVEPSGETVIAGRADPDSDITLMDGDKVIAHVHSDASGQFALVPDSLGEGSHYLTLNAAKAGKAPVKSAQGVAVSVAKPGTAKPLVALLAPDKPAQVLSDGAAIGAATPLAGAKGGAPAGSALPVAIQSVEAAQGGKFTAAGVAHPGSQCRVYLNGAYLADVTAGQDGHWSVEIKKGMKPGRYTVRADEMAPGGDKVAHRAEVPFDYPVTMAGRSAGSGKQLLMARAGSPPVAASAVPPVTATAEPAQLPVQTAGPAATLQTSATPASMPAVQQQASAALPPLAADPGSSASPAAVAVIADLHTTTVLHGDSLWRISRKMLGHGIQYTEIYASNVGQIRDPALIYPGQIFVVPNKKPN